MKELRQTPMYVSHQALGAKMVPFAGYEMPVQYKGIIEEHEAVRKNMGLFDVSHMGEIEIQGERALDFCQKVSSNDASLLKAGKVQYSTILNEDGGIIDDCTLYRLADAHFLFVVNASRNEEVYAWFQKQKIEGAEIKDCSDSYGLIALQGPKAEAFLNKIVKRDLATVGYYEFTWTEVLGAAVLISRTGYTGENGFEIYIPTAKSLEVWEHLLVEGKGEGLVPVGLGARDTLRLEMGYLLYGTDMDTGNTPYEAALGWVVKLKKGSFVGREALVKQKEAGVKKRIRGIKIEGKGIPRSHYEVYQGETRVGEVSSGTFSPTLKSGIGLAYLDAEIGLDQKVDVLIRKKRFVATVVKPPFVAGSIKK